MPKSTPEWKSYIPEFLGEIASAKSEADVISACQAFKSIVINCYPNTPDSRRRPMSEIRKAIKERYPAQESENDNAPFPYFFTTSGKGNVARWEHLAMKHLKEEWNPQNDWSDVAVVKEESPVVKTVKTEIDIFNQFGLNDEELATVNAAIGDADVKEWIKQALLQRANAINALRNRIEEDLSEVPSEVLMNEKKYRTSPTAARELASRAVRVVKRWNYDHPDQKWCITNKLISELTGITVKAIAKAVEGMDLESYNKSHDLTPIANRMVKSSIGEASQVMGITNVMGTEGSEENYKP